MTMKRDAVRWNEKNTSYKALLHDATFAEDLLLYKSNHDPLKIGYFLYWSLNLLITNTIISP